MKNASTTLRIACAFGFFAVVLGALGAHALETRLSVEALNSFKTGVRYQAWHALALLFVAWAQGQSQIKGLHWVSIFFTLGTFFFSGSIYLLSTQNLTSLSWSWLGPVTPIGGLFFMVGWLLLFVKASSIFKS